MTVSTNRLEWFAIILMILGGAIIEVCFAYAQGVDGLFDDGYITFRYAANIASGNGFVYNLGERVLGTTSPALALLLALGRVIFPSLPLENIMLSIGIACQSAVITTIACFLRRAQVDIAVRLTILAILALAPTYTLNAVSGMETPIVFFLMALSLMFASFNQPRSLGIVVALLFMFRIDSLWWSGCVLGAYAWDNRFQLKNSCAQIFIAGALTISPWVLFATIYFGQIIPGNVFAKVWQPNQIGYTWQYILDFCNALYPLVPVGTIKVWTLPAIVIALTIGCIGGIVAWNRHTYLRCIAAYLVIFSAFLFLLRAPLNSWYMPVPRFCWWLLILLGVERLTRYVCKNHTWSTIITHVIVALTGISILIFPALKTYPKRWEETKVPVPSTLVASYIEKVVAPKQRVFYEHIGLAGFRTNALTLDLAGLISPEVFEVMRQHPGRSVIESLRQFKPEFTLLYGGDLIMRSRVDELWFSQNYLDLGVVEPYWKTRAFARMDIVPRIQGKSGF